MSDKINVSNVYINLKSQIDALKESGVSPERVSALETAVNNLNIEINGDSTATPPVSGLADMVPFAFGIDETTGEYGYIKAGADTVTPFKSGPTITDTPSMNIIIAANRSAGVFCGYWSKIGVNCSQNATVRFSTASGTTIGSSTSVTASKYTEVSIPEGAAVCNISASSSLNQVLYQCIV